MSGKELDIEEFSIQLARIILFLNFQFYSLILLRCFGLHQYIRANVLNNVVKRVNPPIPKMSLRVMSLTTEQGPVPEITIDRDTKVKVTPHFLSARRAAEETIPTIAAGQPRLIARVIFATFSGGP